MTVIRLLSSSLGVRSEVPNQKLAWELASTSNMDAIAEIVHNLQSNKDKNIQNDCIKVLYEIGYKKPELIAEFLPVFISLLKSKNNRHVWGAMIAISVISRIDPEKVYSNLAGIMQALDKGSVITKDAGVEILANLASSKYLYSDSFALLMEQLKVCPAKQLPQYAEKALKTINSENSKEFSDILNSRFEELTSDSQKKRITSVLKKAANQK